MPNHNGFKENTVKIFLSYSTLNKEIAGRIKQELEGFGTSVFLAHEDIDPGEEWERAIIQNLKDCDVLIPLLTYEYRKSEWTDQEIGFAIAHNKKIVPVQIELVPYGFVKRFQSLKMPPEKIPSDIPNVALEIFKAIKRDDRYKETLLKSLIEAFRTTWSFEDAAIKSELLVNFEEFTQEQIEEISSIAIENRCVRDSFKGKPNIIKWIKKYKKYIKSSHMEELKRIYGV